MIARNQETIGSRLDRFKGMGPGFDFLRVTLALLVVLNHSFLIVNGNFDVIDRNKLWTIFGSTVPLFFALSGFLISASAQRLKLKDFILNRAIRIVPALAMDVFISALVIGPLVTTYDLSAYIENKRFSHYFLNIIGFIHYELPGVFLSNPFPDQVNGSLWTVPYEIGCYILMSLFIALQAIKSRRFMMIALGCFVMVYYALSVYFQDHHALFGSDRPFDNYLRNFTSARGNYLYLYFLSGIAVYIFRDSIPYSKKLALLAVVIIIMLGLGFLPVGTARYIIAAPCIGYLAAFIGLLPIKKLPLYSRGDYSYGIYLYAYPIQQMLILVHPGGYSVWLHFLISAALVTIVAMFSWHCVEKPILSLRKKFSFTARKGDYHPQLPR